MALTPSWASLRIRPSSLLFLPLLLQEHAPALPGAPFSSQQYYSELRRVRRHTDPRGAGVRRSSPPQKGFLKETRCRRGRTSTELFLSACSSRTWLSERARSRWHAERIIRVGALLASTPATPLVLFNLNPTRGDARRLFDLRCIPAAPPDPGRLDGRVAAASRWGCRTGKQNLFFLKFFFNHFTLYNSLGTQKAED